MKMKQQAYLGRPAIALYLTNYTNKMRQKLHIFERQELK